MHALFVNRFSVNFGIEMFILFQQYFEILLFQLYNLCIILGYYNLSSGI
jgi:hypothetical protein